MERLGHKEFNEPGARFALDNILDGARDNTLLVWQAHDTKTDDDVWVLGRKVRAEGGRVDVLPVAIVIEDSLACVRRYAPANQGGGWDYSQVQQKKIL